MPLPRMTPRLIHRILIAALVICLLSLAGYLVGKWAEPPTIATWNLEESTTINTPPTDRLIEKQIRALTQLDPVQTAAYNFQNVDAWLYALKTKDGWTVPGIPPTSYTLTSGLLKVKIIAWTGNPAQGPQHQELDRAATDYATKYNQRTEVILCTN